MIRVTDRKACLYADDAIEQNVPMKPIPSAPNYFALSTGRIVRYKTIKNPSHAFGNRREKYYYLRTIRGKRESVTLFVDGKSIQKSVHRLILEAFDGPCPDGMEARHLNGNKLDNRLRNLAWGTRKENMQDRTKHGTAKLSHEDIYRIRQLRGQSFQKDIAKKFNVSRSYVSMLHNNKRGII